MNLSVNFPPEVEAALRQRASSTGKNLETLVTEIVADDVAEELPTPPSGESTEIFMARLKAMIARHAVRCGHVDDSRESIYFGRGE